MDTSNTSYTYKIIVKSLIETGLYRNILLATLFINLLVLAVPLYTMNVYDRVLPDFDKATLLVLTLGVFIALVFDFILKVLRTQAYNALANSINFKSESAFFEEMLSEDDLHSISTGQKLTLFQELSQIRHFQLLKVVPFLFYLPFFLLFVFIIYLISPLLSLVPLIGAFLLVGFGFVCVTIASFYEEDRLKAAQGKSSVFLELLQGAETLKLLNAIETYLSKWRGMLAKQIGLQKTEHFIQNLLGNAATSMSYIVSVSVIFWGSYEVSHKTLTLGGLIAASILVNRALAPVTGLMPLLSGYQAYKASLNKVRKLFDTNESKRSSVPLEVKPLKGAVSLQNVSYAFAGQDKNALNGVKLEIKANARIGIIGPSGAGKSTLTKLVAGVLGPQEGHVMWDGFHFDAIPKEQRAEHLGLATQEDYIFSGTLADNIFIGSNEAYKDDSDHVEKVFYLSGLDLLMRQSTYGLDTVIHERGNNLSTGAKQSISLARAMMRKPKILILDEPLNGLDYTIEKRLLDHLPSWLEGATFIMITHRTSLLPLVEEIVFLEGGQVKKHGARDDIIKALSS